MRPAHRGRRHTPAGDAAETPFFPADGQVLVLDGLYRETVLPQPNGGFFKETELRGFVLFVHCEVLLVSKKISRSILKMLRPGDELDRDALFDVGK